MSARRVLITGAGRGLGRALAAACVARGDRVFGAVRAADARAQLPAGTTGVCIDVSDAASIQAGAAAVAAQADRLDWLINNAGIHSGSPEILPHQKNLSLGALEPSGMVRMFTVNALGPLLLTQALLPLLRCGVAPLVVNVSSRRGSLARNQSGGNYGYTTSKAALNMITRGLAADLAGEVTVAAVHPGTVQTAMGGPDATMTAAEAADAFLRVADGLGPEDTGRFLRWDGTPLPW